MDAVEKLHDNFLSCSICMERYRDPCTLTCGHTFCRECLGKFTKTRQDAIKARSILCAYCKQMIAVPHPSKPVKDWPKQFKPHILMQGLLDTFPLEENATETLSKDCCFSCHQMGEKTSATSLCHECNVVFCDKCVKMHRAMPGMNAHAVSGITEESKITQGRKVICKEHNSLVEFCCKDCNKAVCQKCCIVYHRKCHSVVTIDSMVSEMKSLLQQKVGEMKDNLKDRKSSLLAHQTQMEEMSLKKESLISEIQKTSRQAMDQIKQKEKQLTDEVGQLTEKQGRQLRGQIKSEELDLQMYEQYFDFIQKGTKSESPMDLYDRYQMFQSGTVTTDVKTGSAAAAPGGSKISFVKDFDERSFDRDICLGHLAVQGEAEPYKLALHTIIETTTSTDSHTSDPNDILVLHVDGMETHVVTDSNNRKIKSFFTKDGQIHTSTLKIGDVPFTMTDITQTRLAISFYHHIRAFAIVKVAPEVSLISKIKTQKPYISLTYLHSSMLAGGTYLNSSTIDILDLSGNVIRSMNASKCSLISQPWYMCTTRKGHILVCDQGSRSVYCLTEKGDTVFTYKPTGAATLTRPLGITTASGGDIFVADYDQHRIIQLDEAGRFVRDILTRKNNINHPQGLFVDKTKLYVTQELKNVSVFHLYSK